MHVCVVPETLLLLPIKDTRPGRGVDTRQQRVELEQEQELIVEVELEPAADMTQQTTGTCARPG